MAGCSLVGGLGTSLVRLELLVLGMGGDPLAERHFFKKWEKLDSFISFIALQTAAFS